MYSIIIEKIYSYQSSMVVGLKITGKCPVFVGCSMRNHTGEIIDRPGQILKSPGIAIFPVSLSKDEGKFKPEGGGWGKGASGQIIIALWENDTFQNRLADTGWVNWKTPWLIMGSTAGLDMMDWEIKTTYKDRFDVWA